MQEKNFLPKILAGFEIKSLYCNERGSRNYVQSNYFHI